MRVQLLGTGSADRWPNPWCGCPSCTWARAAGQVRNRTSVLVDGCLLIDPGPDIGARGADLTGVRTVLVTHDHPDHLDPAFLLAWRWSGGADLVVAGPAQAIARCRQWVAPEAPVRFVALTAGDELSAGCHQVRALAAAHSTTGGWAFDGTAVLFELSAPGARLLYATDTAALPHGELRGQYDLVLLELTFGDFLDHGSAHLDLPAFGHEVSRLRAEGRLAAGSRVVAVHLSHHNGADLLDRLAPTGAEAPPDGTVLVVGGHDAGTAAPPARRLLVTGGARSGKSHRAEAVAAAAAASAVHYVATAPSYPDDPEWHARIAAHRQRRPASWRTLETIDVAAVLRTAEPGSCVLVDCLTLWTTGIVDAARAWTRPNEAHLAVADALADLVGALGRTSGDVVLVTNEVGHGLVPEQASGRLFRDLLGQVNVAVAAACDDVEIVTCGIARTLKGTQWTPST